MDSIWIILIVILSLLALCALRFIIVYIKKRMKINKEKIKKPKVKKNKKEKLITSGSLTVSDNYITAKEIKFLDSLLNILPSNFIAIPRVSVTDIIKPVGSRVNYEKLNDKKVDICIFEKYKMTPKIIIDLYDDTFVNQDLFTDDSYIVYAFKTVKLPILKIKIQRDYNIAELQDLIKPYID